MTNATTETAVSLITSIRIEWSESSDIEDGKEFVTMVAFDNYLREASFNSPKGGCYDKTKFVITWRDGGAYTGRIDLVHPSEADAFCGIAAHVAEFCQWVISEPGIVTLSRSALDIQRTVVNHRLMLANIKSAMCFEEWRAAQDRVDASQVKLDEIQAELERGRARLAEIEALEPELRAS